MVCSPTFTIKINQMQVNMPYRDGIGHNPGKQKDCFRIIDQESLKLKQYEFP